MLYINRSDNHDLHYKAVFLSFRSLSSITTTVFRLTQDDPAAVHGRLCTA